MLVLYYVGFKIWVFLGKILWTFCHSKKMYTTHTKLHNFSPGFYFEIILDKSMFFGLECNVPRYTHNMTYLYYIIFVCVHIFSHTHILIEFGGKIQVYITLQTYII